MKGILNGLIVMLVVIVTCDISAQVNKQEAMGYLVEAIEAPLSITRVQLEEATTIKDLNDRYDAEWVRQYIEVEIETVNNGNSCKAIGKDGILTVVQKDNMSSADEGSEISVKVRYIPENNLVRNDEKEMEFSFEVNPETSAAFVGGEDLLADYLDKNNINDIIEMAFVDEGLVAAKFTISEAGEIENVHIVESSNDDATDSLLLDVLQQMPPWQPATYRSGRQVKQEMILTAGNLHSCMMNLVKYTNRKI